jgi:hypothetical protein
MNNEINSEALRLKDYVVSKLSTASIFYLGRCAKWDDIENLPAYQSIFSDNEIKFIYYYHESAIWAILSKVSDRYCRDCSDVLTVDVTSVKNQKNQKNLMLSEVDQENVAINGLGFKKLIVILTVMVICVHIVDKGEV